ncbi:MAG: DNA polymerase III subunit delta' [bacterium]|nr:DNA polymerase III subunit delta' [bacterium]
MNPSPFSQIAGQEHAVTILGRAVRNNHLSHAYLFYGPEGIGKALAAKALAKAVNCEERYCPADSPCSSCRKIEANIHPDVEEIRPAGNFILIGQIRGIKGKLALKPLGGEKRVFIILEAERMNTEAANAFLVTLEEPPSETIIILVTRDYEAVLPTISSRCQGLRFNPLPGKAQEKVLIQWGVDPEAIPSLIQLSGGSLGLAKQYLEEGLLEKEQMVKGWLERILKEGYSAVFSLSGEMPSSREEVCDLLDLLELNFRRSLISQIEGKPGVNEIARLRKISPGKLEKLIELVEETKRLIKGSVNLQLAVEVMWLKLIELAS